MKDESLVPMKKAIDEIVAVSRVEKTVCVYGVGMNDVAFRVSLGGKHIWQYTLWKNMLGRCYLIRENCRNKTYIDVAVCDDWLSFGNFLEWVNKEVRYKGKPVGMALDKDLIVRGNKLYSPEFCSFVPRQVNNLVLDSASIRGNQPMGVHFNRDTGRFFAQISDGGVMRHLGSFGTAEQAFLAYKIAKEAHIRVVAIQYKNVLKPAVFESLMNWDIEK